MNWIIVSYKSSISSRTLVVMLLLALLCHLVWLATAVTRNCTLKGNITLIVNRPSIQSIFNSINKSIKLIINLSIKLPEECVPTSSCPEFLNEQTRLGHYRLYYPQSILLVNKYCNILNLYVNQRHPWIHDSWVQWSAFLTDVPGLWWLRISMENLLREKWNGK